MSAYPWTMLVLLLISVLQLWLMARVGKWRGRSGIAPPAMTGDPAMERAIRVHENTLEQLGMFLPALVVSAAYSGDLCAASIGALWLVGRVMYAIGYQREVGKRSMGFLVTFLALLAALGAGGWGLLKTVI